MTSIAVRGLRKSFGDVHVLREIDLDVGAGQFVVFVGPSGCGKSTLLRMICGLEEVSAGTIAIDGEVVNDVPPAQRGIAMVFQSYALYPHMTVAQNMGYSLSLAGIARRDIDARVARAAAVLRLDALLQRKPRELSGGQRQRVAIGRAIVREPRLFLFDEPLSNLDAALRVDMRAEIAALKARLGTTMVYVTHDQVEAMTLADRIVVMNAGRIEQAGSPLELYRTPANRFVATFIGSPRMNLLPAVIEGMSGVRVVGGAVLPLHVDAPAGAEVEVGVRAEHIAVGDGSGTTRGEVKLVEHLGSDAFLHVALPGVERWVIVRRVGDADVGVGSAISLAIPPKFVHVFAADGRRIEAKAPMRQVA